MKLVVDASVIGKVWVREQGSAKARELFAAGSDGRHELLAPSHMPIETMSIFLQARIMRGQEKVSLTGRTMRRYVGDLMDAVNAGIVRIVPGDEAWLNEAMKEASLDTKGQGYLSIYDTMYHALARHEDALFLTADDKFSRKLMHHVRLRSSVVLLDDFVV